MDQLLEVIIHTHMVTLQSLDKKIDQKFGLVDKRFEQMDQKFESMFQKTFDMIEHLAIMTKDRFDEVEERFEKRFDTVEFRLDRIEDLSIGGQERRIESLEDNMRLVKTKLKLV